MTEVRHHEKLDLFGKHYIKAKEMPEFVEGGVVTFESGEHTYLVTTCHRGMKDDRVKEGLPLARLGMFPADDTWFEVWCEDAWFL